MKYPATAKIVLTSKRIGKAQTRTHRVGSKCTIERSGEHAGQFIIWFPEYFYLKCDARELHDLVKTSLGTFK